MFIIINIIESKHIYDIYYEEKKKQQPRQAASIGTNLFQFKTDTLFFIIFFFNRFF